MPEEGGGPPFDAAKDYYRTIHVYNIETGLARFLSDNLLDMVKADCYKPINVVFHSYGGDVFESIAVWDSIMQARNSLVGQRGTMNGLCSGYAMSAASYLLQAFDVRRMTEHSYMMVHGISQGGYGDAKVMEQNNKILKLMRDSYAEAFTVRSHKPRKFWDKIMADGTPLYFTAKESLELGLIDEIVDTSWTRKEVAA